MSLLEETIYDKRFEALPQEKKLQAIDRVKQSYIEDADFSDEDMLKFNEGFAQKTKGYMQDMGFEPNDLQQGKLLNTFMPEKPSLSPQPTTMEELQQNQIKAEGDFQRWEDQGRLRAETEAQGLEMPVVSPEFAMLGSLRAGQGAVAKTAGNMTGNTQLANTGQKMLTTGKGFTVGSVAGDASADMAIGAVNELTPEDFKQTHPTLYMAMNLTAGLAGGIGGGVYAESKYLKRHQKIIDGVKAGKVSADKAEEIIRKDKEAVEQMSKMFDDLADENAIKIDDPNVETVNKTTQLDNPKIDTAEIEQIDKIDPRVPKFTALGKKDRQKMSAREFKAKSRHIYEKYGEEISNAYKSADTSLQKKIPAQAQRVREAGEIPVGGSEDEAKEAVNNVFKKQLDVDAPYKNLSKEAREQLEAEHKAINNEPLDVNGNALFAKGADNLVAGTVAGIETDEEGNVSFDPEKFIIGLGGYTATKAFLKNPRVQQELKEYAQKAIDAVDMNPQIQKKNGFNAMVSSKSAKKPKDKLYASHRTNINNLSKMLDEGVLPAPSFAVAKNSRVTDKFGDIIIVPKEKHIDPKKGAHVYGGDAWTPRVKFDPNENMEVLQLDAPVFDRFPKLKQVAKNSYDGDDFYNQILNDEKYMGWMEDWANKTGRDTYELAQMVQKQVFKSEAPSLNKKLKEMKKLVKDNGGDLRGLEDAWTPEYVHHYKKYGHLDDVAKRGDELKTYKNQDRFYDEAHSAMKKGDQPPADYMEAKRLDKVALDDVDRIIAPTDQFDEVSAMVKEKGLDVKVVRQRSGETSNSAIKRSSSGDSVYIHSNPLEAIRFIAEDIPIAVMDATDWTIRKVQKLMLKGDTIDTALGKLLKNRSNNEVIDAVKRAVVQDYRLSDDYLKLADDAQISIKRAEARAGEMFDSMKGLSDEASTEIHNYVAGESMFISDHLRPVADKAKRFINAQMKMQVDMGTLPSDVMKAYKGGYINRQYEKHLKKAIADFFNTNTKAINREYKRGKMELFDEWEYKAMVDEGKIGDNIRDAEYVYEGKKGDKIQLRRDWTAKERKEMGEVTNASFTVPNTIMKLQKDIAYAKFLTEVAENPKMKDFVRTEKDMMKEMGVKSAKDMPKRANGFEKLQGRQYGKLSGTYVDEAVANDIKGFEESLHGFENKYREFYRSFLTQWKLSKTIKNPTAHMNNFVSNMSMQYYAGVKPTDIIKNTSVAMSEMKNKGKLFKEAEEIGLFGRSKLEDIKNSIDTPEKKAQGLFQKIWKNFYLSEDSAIGKHAFKMYALEDDVMRLSLFKHHRDKGLSDVEAMKETSKVIFDYSKRMPSFMRSMRDAGVVPFISWTYKSIPLMFETTFQRPSRLASIVGMYYVYDQWANGGDEKPPFMQGKYVTLKNDGDTSMQLRTASMFPYFDWFTEPAQTGKQLMLGGIPQKAVEGVVGTQFWNDQKISYREGFGALADYTMWGMNSFSAMPAVHGKIYGTAEAFMNDGEQVKRNKLFKPRSTAESATGLFGLNVKSYNIKENKKRLREDEKRKLKKERKNR